MLTAMFLAVTTRVKRDERGDVPGWVMITVMTAAVVVGLMQVAAPQLKGMFEGALKSVKP